jgi:hypothetical protein
VKCLVVLSVLGCVGEDDTVRADVQRLALVGAEGGAGPAAERVARHGRRALPSIEAALHTAEAAGRKNLIAALRKIGEAESVPLLRHVALFDAAADVRREAEWTLRSWATGDGARAVKAREALRVIEERRAREETG